MTETKIKTMTCGRFIELLQNLIKSGDIKPSTELWQATDEEGNSYSPVTFEGTKLEEEGLTLYPILVEHDFG